MKVIYKDVSQRYEVICKWLFSDHARQSREIKSGGIEKFLDKLDEFDLNEYIKAIRFDEMKVPALPFQLPVSKSYFGIKEMMESELDFLKATVLSRSNEPVIMYSSLPRLPLKEPPHLIPSANAKKHYSVRFSNSKALSAPSYTSVSSFQDQASYLLRSGQRANDLLSNACPLMEIYRSDREKDFSNFLTADSHRRGRRRSILSDLPVYTICVCA